MGCGAQRVIHNLLHGDITGAFKANALFTILSPIIIFLLWLELKRKDKATLYAKIYSPITAIVMASILMSWFILRNLIGM